MSKYGAKPMIVDGIRFDSRLEARRYGELKLLEMAGEISYLVCHPRFVLQKAFEHAGERIRAVEYEADFQYQDNATGGMIVEEIKGFETTAWKVKQKLFYYQYPDVDFRIIKV